MGKAVNNLVDYVELDNAIVERDNSDFANYCQSHCEDITEVCDCIKLIRDYIDNLSDNDFEKYSEYQLVISYMQEIKDTIKKVLD